MKALSLWQPWAQLWLGPKVHETRSWRTTHRGPLLVHAAQRWGPEQKTRIYHDPEFREAWEAVKDPRAGTVAGVPLGAYVGVVDVVACVRTDELEVDEREQLMGDFSPARWAWRRGGAIRFPRPVPGKGHQGMWTPPPAELDAIMAELRGVGGLSRLRTLTERGTG